MAKDRLRGVFEKRIERLTSKKDHKRAAAEILLKEVAELDSKIEAAEADLRDFDVFCAKRSLPVLCEN